MNGNYKAPACTFTKQNEQIQFTPPYEETCKIMLIQTRGKK